MFTLQIFRGMTPNGDPVSSLFLQGGYKRSHPKSRTVSGKPLTNFANTLAKHLDAVRDCFIYFSYSPLDGTLRATKMRPTVAVLLSPVLWHGFFHHHTSVQGGPALHSLCTPALHASTAFAREEALLQSSSLSQPC